MSESHAFPGAALAPQVMISRTNREVLPRAPIHWCLDEGCLIDSVMEKCEFDILKTWKLRRNG